MEEALLLRLRSSIADIKQQVTQLEHDLNNGPTKVKSKCANLRAEIKYAAKCSVDSINQMSDSLTRQVNAYEFDCMSAYEREAPVQKRELTALLEEMCQFNLKWEDYLQQANLSNQLISDANETASSLKRRSSLENKKFDQFLFNKKSIQYERNMMPISKDTLGTILIEELKSIDNLHIKEIVNDLNLAALHLIEIEQLENENYYIVYQTAGDLLKAVTIDRDSNVLSNYTYSHGIIKFKKFKDMIYINYRDTRGYYYLQALSVKLKEMQSVSLYHAFGTGYDHPVSFLAANDTNIYCLQSFSNQLRIFDKKFHYLKSIGQVNNSQNPFYFPKSIIQFECKSGKYYWLNHASVNILAEASGELIRCIPVSAGKFFFDSNDNVLVLDKLTKKLGIYTSIGILLKKIQIFNYSVEQLIFLDRKDNLIVTN